jgi:hypothetical protein
LRLEKKGSLQSINHHLLWFLLFNARQKHKKMPVASTRSSNAISSKNRETNARVAHHSRRPFIPNNNPWKKINTKIAKLSISR